MPHTQASKDTRGDDEDDEVLELPRACCGCNAWDSCCSTVTRESIARWSGLPGPFAAAAAAAEGACAGGGMAAAAAEHSVVSNVKNMISQLCRLPLRLTSGEALVITKNSGKRYGLKACR